MKVGRTLGHTFLHAKKKSGVQSQQMANGLPWARTSPTTTDIDNNFKLGIGAVSPDLVIKLSWSAPLSSYSRFVGCG